MTRSLNFSSVHERWCEALTARLPGSFVCSPYLTPKLAIKVIESASPESCVVYTRFSIEDFAGGSSSIKVLRHLCERGFLLFEIPRLHAKLVFVPTRFASIGSQNVTAQGTRNREATYSTADSLELALFERKVAPWLSSATPITLQMIEDAEELLPPVVALFKVAQLAAEDAQIELAARAEKRTVSEKAALRIAAEQAARVSALSANGRAAIARSAPNRAVSREIAEHFLSGSVWWHTHSSGSPVRASGFVRRIFEHGGNFSVKFGGNTFLISVAIRRCIDTLHAYLESLELGVEWKKDYLIHRLWKNVSGAVANINGYEYAGYYPVTHTDMMFGAQSIDVREFVQAVLAWLPDQLRKPLDVLNNRTSFTGAIA